MNIGDRFKSIFAEFEAILKSIAQDAAAVAPVAETIEAVVAPEDVAPTVAAADVAEKVADEIPAPAAAPAKSSK